jgi:hypothetical protein
VPILLELLIGVEVDPRRLELNRLEDPSELTPVAKLAILVECHKIIVDGLSKAKPLGVGDRGLEGGRELDREDASSISTTAGRSAIEDPSELTPVAKLAILVECHKIIVDGLSNLPAIRLKKSLHPGIRRRSDVHTPLPTRLAMASRLSRGPVFCSELTPVAKLAILVECHKIIVDGLSNLPAIRLKKDPRQSQNRCIQASEEGRMFTHLCQHG